MSRSAVELIKAFEGFRSRAAQLDDGRWTIGYGHTLTARAGAEITERDAEALLLYDLIQAAHAVNEHVYAPLNQNQFDALVSLVFNIGPRAFRGSPTLRRLNEGRPLEAAMAMEMWRKSDLDGERIVIDALVRRRAAEKALFLKPMEGWTPAPTPVLPPRIDYDALALMPLTGAAVARANLDGERAAAARADEPVFHPADEPSASAAAAAAVIERLEAILHEPHAEEPAKPSPVEPLKPAAARPEPGVFSARPFDRGELPFVAVEPSRRRGIGVLALVAIGAVGLGLTGLGGFWLMQPATDEILGLAPGVAGLAAAGPGVALAAAAIYFLLDRIGRPRSR
ncbi:MAG TPA: lysozyme [Caulobacteraceae bacterium]|nr:lysozyme [Caulobacteraceae bacterium]